RDFHVTGVQTCALPIYLVTLTTRRGSITLRVRKDRDVAPGMVFVPFCFNEAAANVLTNPQLDPFGKIPEFKFAAVRLEPAEAVRSEERRVGKECGYREM